MNQLQNSFVQDIAGIWKSARSRAYTLVNRAMTDAYWEIGQRIVQEEQKGDRKAQYGQYLLRELAAELTSHLDKKLDERELRKMRQFYFLFPNRDSLRPELTWTHYRLLLRVEDPKARSYYAIEAATQGWGTRQLERNIQSAYYIRLMKNRLPQNQSEHNDLSNLSPQDFIKDPYVMEFLGLDIPSGFSENELESAILSKIHQFLLEMGKGFAFVGRQYQIKTETKEFYIDLVFYNFILKCFVLVDLKITELSHADIGQMDMYVRMFERLKKVPGDNPTIGIILCSEKDETLIKYSMLEDSTQLFASKYRLILPSDDEFKREIDQVSIHHSLKSK